MNSDAYKGEVRNLGEQSKLHSIKFFMWYLLMLISLLATISIFKFSECAKSRHNFMPLIQAVVSESGLSNEFLPVFQGVINLIFVNEMSHNMGFYYQGPKQIPYHKAWAKEYAILGKGQTNQAKIYKISECSGFCVPHLFPQRWAGVGSFWAGIAGLCDNGGPVTLSLHSTSVETDLTVVSGSLGLPAVDRSCLKMPATQTLGLMGH